MASLVCNLGAKQFQALISGLSKFLYFDESSTYTPQYFRETLFGNSGDIDIDNILNFFKQLITKSAENNWDVSQVEEKLNKLEGDISADQKNVFIFFWTNEREKVCPHLSIYIFAIILNLI